MPVSAVPSPRPVVRVAVGLVIALATVAVYAGIASHPFLEYDDGLYVTHNPVVQQGLRAETVRWALTSADAHIWHPLTWLSLLVDAELWGVDSAGPWLLENLGWHVASACALLALLSSTTRRFWPSAWVAAAFALHPIQVESVAWVSARKELMAGFAAIATLAAYVHYARGPSRARYLAVATAFALCLSAKSSHVALPVAMLLLDDWPLGRARSRSDWRRLVAEKLPLLALAALAVWIQWSLVSGITGPWATDPPLLERARDAVMAMAATLGRLLWPDALAIVYPTPRQMGLAPVGPAPVAAALLGAGALTFGAARAGAARGPLWVGWLWFLALLAPMAGWLPSGLRVMHDRYAYLPMIGIALALGFGAPALARAPKLRPALACAGLLALLGCALASAAQVRVWRDSLALFDHALAVTERNALAHYFKGNTLAEHGDFDAARPEFEAALAIHPDFPQANRALGFLFVQTRRPALAIAPLRRALAARPTWTQARVDLARALWRTGDGAAAVRLLEAALATDPASADARYWLDRVRAAPAPRTSRTRDSSVSGWNGLRTKPESSRSERFSVARSSE